MSKMRQERSSELSGNGCAQACRSIWGQVVKPRLTNLLRRCLGSLGLKDESSTTTASRMASRAASSIRKGQPPTYVGRRRRLSKTASERRTIGTSNRWRGHGRNEICGPHVAYRCRVCEVLFGEHDDPA